nr:hypothetical protein [Tanacetum cinerariifolium]
MKAGIRGQSHVGCVGEAPQIVLSFVQSSEQVKSPRHSVQPVETSIPAATPKPASPNSASSGKRRNRKSCFMCKSVDHLIKDCDYHAKKMVQPTQRNYEHMGNHKQYALLTHTNPQKHMVPTAVLTQSKSVFNTAVRPVSAAVPKINVTRPRYAHLIVTKSKSPTRRHITSSPSLKTSNSPPKVTAAQAPVVSAAQDMQENGQYWLGSQRESNHPIYVQGNPQYALKDNGVIDSGCLRHVTINMSYLSDFKELNGGYVAFGGNPKGGKISGKEKIKTGVFLATKDETSPILNTFITGLENQLSLKVKVIRSDNGTKFKNFDLNQTLIDAARTMLVNLLLPIPFWAEAVNTACYVQNRVLVTKPHNKTPYKLLHGRTPSIGFMRPFGCLVTILNTLDPLGKFKGKVDEGFLVGYSVSSKAFRVFNSRSRIVQETLHVNFLENKPNITGSDPTLLFHIDSLTRTMNYQPVIVENQTNPSAGLQDKFDAEKAGEEVDQQYVLFPIWSSGSTNPQNNDGDAAFNGKKHDFDEKKPESDVNVSPSSNAQSRKQDDKTKKEAKGKSPVESFTRYKDLSTDFKDCTNNSINEVNAAGSIVYIVGKNSPNSINTFSAAGPSNAADSPTYGKYSFIDASQLPNDPDMPELEDIIYSDDDNDVGAEADFNNLETSITVSPIPTTRVHKDYLVSQIIGDMSSTTQTKSMTRVVNDQGEPSQMFNDDFHTCMFSCLLSQEEPKRIYVDDIIFGATNKDLCKSFEKLMKDKFQMSSIGELTFFLGLQVKQKKDEIFISQDKYVAEILRKFRLTKGKSASTPIDTEKPLLKDPNGEDVDVHTYSKEDL